jgi:hypothetical protein
MSLLPHDGETLPEIPKVPGALTPEGAIIIDEFEGMHFYRLECGHRILTKNVRPVDMAFNAIPCLRCHEILLGTVDAE